MFAAGQNSFFGKDLIEIINVLFLSELYLPLRPPSSPPRPALLLAALPFLKELTIVAVRRRLIRFLILFMSC